MIKKSLCLTLLAILGKVDAQTWVGATPSLTLNTNWSPAVVPGGADSAIFTGAGNPTPTLSGINLTTADFSFPNNSSYAFTVNSGSALSLQVSGIVNTGGATQTFDIAGIFNFNNSTSAGTGAIINGTVNNALIRFNQNSSAGNAQINLLNGADLTMNNFSSLGNAILNSTGGTTSVALNNSSTAGNAQINMSAGIISFDTSSTAGSAVINLSNTDIGFFGSSSAGSAVINASNSADVSFSNTSTAAFAVVNMSSGSVLFGINATAANSQINLSNGSQLIFSNSSLGASATVTLETGSSFTINQNNTLGSLSLDAASTGNLNSFNLQIGSSNTSETIAGIIIGAGGSLTKVGTGTQILSGVNTYTGPTTLNGGALILTGAVGGDFIVNTATTSSGNGTVGGTYTQNAGSFFLVDQPDFLNVVGPVVINGGEVLVADAAYPANTPFVILHSDVSRTGIYDGVSALNPNAYFIPQLSYDAQNVYLTIATQFQFFALTPNEIAVAGALDFASDPTLLAALTSLGGSDFLNALNQLSGVQYANLVQLSELSNQRFVQQIFDPMRASILKPNASCGRWTTWGSVEGGQAFLSSDYNAKGFKMAGGNVTLGAYRSFFPNVSFGFAQNYEYDQVEFYQGGKGIANTWQGAIYGLASHPLGYLFGEVGGGYSHWQVNRILNFGGFVHNAVGKTHVSHVAAYGELGLNTWVEQFLIQPFFALQYGHYWRAHIDEVGADVANLTLASQSLDDVESRLGAHVSTGFGPLLLSADASWRYRYSQLGDEINLNFASFGPEFTILGPHQNRSFFEGALYAQTPLSPTLLLYIQGDGLINNRFGVYSASIGLQKVW